MITTIVKKMPANVLIDLSLPVKSHPGSARKFGTPLIAIGLAAAMTVSIHSAFIAFLLIVFVWAYDSGGKKTFLGPFLMGGCRGLDILLGASLIPWSDSRFNLIAIIAVCMAGLYWRSDSLRPPRSWSR